MAFFVNSKAQIVCLLILLFITYLYIKDGKHIERMSGTKHCNMFFDWMLACATASLFFDGVTAYTANHYKTVSSWLNEECHFLFYVSIILFSTCYFLYWLSIAGKLPDKPLKRILYYIPAIIAMYMASINMKTIEYVEGRYVVYSMGFAVYFCLGVVVLYLIATMIVLFASIKNIRDEKRTSLIFCMVIANVVLMIQGLFPEMLISCFAVTLIIVLIYIEMENPSVKMVEVYHEEMLLGFSALLEKKDGGTGGHVRRTSEYAVIIARELGKLPKYKDHITREYIKNLKQAAPMHDIGKISIPDNILQKPGKLTDEEFTTMKTHSSEGAKIIKETFSHLVEDEEGSMAYKVALNHHEKWNGRGYPNGIAAEEIPLCARIMAVADVFDAVSAKRCYRDAMPLQKCFAIIYEGKGTDFDPEIVDAFFERQKEIVRIYNKYREAE